MNKNKCIIVGDDTVGKTSFLITTNIGVFPGEYIPTIYDIFSYTIDLEDESIDFEIQDTVGNDDYKLFRPMSYVGAKLVLLAFSLADQKSFKRIEKVFFPEVTNYCPNVPCILVGLKSYLRDEKEAKGHKCIPTAKGEELKQKIGAMHYIECDSLHLYHINDINKLIAKYFQSLIEKEEEENNSYIQLNPKYMDNDSDSTENSELEDKKSKQKEEKKTFSITPPDQTKQEGSARIQTLIQSLKSELKNKNHMIADLQSEIEQKTLDYNKILSKQKKLKVRLEMVEKENESLQQKLGEEIQPKKIDIIDSKSIAEYETIEDIGVGSSGRVVKVAKQTIFAMKIMSNMNAEIEDFHRFINEYNLMNMLNHPNILKAFTLFMSDEKNPPAILLEFCPQNLVVAITNKNLSNINIACSIYQIAEGMRYIHFNKIIHRDLKPSNILIANDGTIKISDFGISKLMTAEQLSMTSGVGTNKFMAPEIIAEEEHYNEKVDVYSFGVLLFYILSDGKLPKIKTPQILQGKKAEIPSSFTDFAKELINKCWNFEPNDRPSFIDICTKLQTDCNQLLNLDENEKNEVDLFIKNHQKRIPKY